MLSILIPANNEAARIGECLTAVLASNVPDTFNKPPEIIVIANGCHDETAKIASSYIQQAKDNGWQLKVINQTVGNKLAALNTGDAKAGFTTRIYLDADVIVSRNLINELQAVLHHDYPVYASGTVVMPIPKTWVSKAYRRIYSRVPFFTHGVPGCGLFAVNQLARKRWGKFPDIISDDTFVRLQFIPKERLRVPATYQWPIVEGFANLIKVRRRQNIGVAQITALYPALMQNDDKPAFSFINILKLMLSDPIGFCIYATVSLAVRMPGNANANSWERGR